MKQMIRKLCLLALTLAPLPAFASPPKPDCPSALLPAQEVLRLAKRVDNLGGYTHIAKFLIDVRGDGPYEARFFDTNQYAIHHEFAMAELGYRGTLESFQEFNYAGSYRDREFVLGGLSIRLTQDGAPEALVELFNGDTLDAETLRLILSAVRRRAPDFSRIRFHPLSEHQELVAASVLPPDDFILTRDLASGLTYLPLNKGVGVGYVRLVRRADYEAGRVLLSPTDIAVFDQVPNDIGLVAGVITAELQTPLSHINVKSINRGTFNAYLADASRQLARHEGRTVRMEINEGSYVVQPIAAAEAGRALDEFWGAKRRQATEEPSYLLDPALRGQVLDLRRFYSRLPTREEHRRLILTVGAKAANLALLSWIARERKLDVAIPGTLGLTFDTHEQFLEMERPGGSVQSRVRRILADAGLLDGSRALDIQAVVPALREIRALIRSSSAPEAAIASMMRAIYDDSASPLHLSRAPMVFLRSSTNSEDLEGFTGAGLYDSEAIALYETLPGGGFDRARPRPRRDVERDLRRMIPYLYSSAFNERAFMEREWFGINRQMHLKIRVALALQPGLPGKSFGGEIGQVANGVAITADLYRSESDSPKVFLNSQHFDLPVTNPPGPEQLRAIGEQPGRPYSTEETIVSTYLANMQEDASPEAWRKWAVDTVRKSSVRGGASVFKRGQPDEVLLLTRAIRQVNIDMATVFGQDDPDEFPIDVEYFVYGPERKLVLVQARPFVRQTP